MRQGDDNKVNAQRQGRGTVPSFQYLILGQNTRKGVPVHRNALKAGGASPVPTLRN
jgi:hypothetical protein